MTIKARILASQTPKIETITVPEWDGVTVELRSARGRTRAKLIDAVSAVPPDDDEQAATRARGRAILPLWPDLIIDAVHDPATGARIFSEEDREAVEDMPEAVKQRIGVKILALSGLGGEVKGADGQVVQTDAVDAAGKSSTPTPSDDSTST